MNHLKQTTCPDPQTLLRFIQGRLEPPELTQCEDHLSACSPCHETLRGLDANDTLSVYVSEALEQKPKKEVSDTQAVAGLMQSLLDPKAPNRPTLAKGIAPEILADRAAEVLRCIEPPTSDDDESLGTLGEYRLLRLIGAGGTGVVFQAKDISLDRLVALKVLRPSLGDTARDRFIAEARLAASIEHDNVVTIYQIGQQGRLAFIAMQWDSGETLEARLAGESAPLDETTIREFISQIASGLSAAHQRQLIHRDIKPANIWICEGTGRIKILDFGLARIADEESSLTQTGMLAGTPNFMSPEQSRGMELDPRSDLFALGCVMYLLLTQRLPFSAPTVLGTLQTIQSASPQPPVALNPTCNTDLSDLTMNLLEKLPGNRMASAENLIQCLNTPRSQWPQNVAKSVNHLGAEGVPVNDKVLIASSSTHSSRTGFRWLIAASLIGLIGVSGWLMAPQIFRIATDQGQLVVETSDDNIKIQVLENGDLVRVLDASSKDSFTIQSGEYSFDVVSKDSNNEFEITPKSVTMTRGGKQLVTVTTAPAKAATAPALRKAEKSDDFRVGDLKATKDVPLYGGQNFEQWYQIAKNDREPRSVSDAIAACGILAEGEQKERFLAQFTGLVRQHGSASVRTIRADQARRGYQPPVTSKDIYHEGFLKAMGRLTLQEKDAFIENEMEFGNGRSLGFCGKIIGKFRVTPKILNLNSLLNRISDGHLDLDNNLNSFIQTCCLQPGTTADPSLCRKAIGTLYMYRRPSLYVQMLRFGNDELGKAMESDFFAASTLGKDREWFVRFLLPLEDNRYEVYDKQHRQTLAIRILTEAIDQIVDSENSDLEFDFYNDICFDKKGVIETYRSYEFRDGQIHWSTWRERSSTETIRAKKAQQIEGRPAIVRHLLTKLCQSLSDGALQEKDHDLVINFANNLTQTSEEFKALKETKDYQDLQIESDLKTLVSFVKGEAEARDFSRFFPSK